MGIRPACGRPMPCTLAQPSPAPSEMLVMLWLPPLLMSPRRKSIAATVCCECSVGNQLTERAPAGL